MALFLTGDAGDEDEVIDAEKAKLVTFCRSANSDTDRENYENMGMRFIAKYNTDFWEIVSKEFDKDYFYQGDLERYAKQLEAVGKNVAIRMNNGHDITRGRLAFLYGLSSESFSKNNVDSTDNSGRASEKTIDDASKNFAAVLEKPPKSNEGY